MKKYFIIGTVALIILVGGTLAYFLMQKPAEVVTETEPSPVVLTIPQKILDNKFGFGGGNNGDGEMITEAGAGWARPHIGPFLWDSMQGQNSAITFTETDEAVVELQENNLGILATLWPFNDVDQKKRADAENCKVSEKDIFFPSSDSKRQAGHYLPLYRCNPHDWDAYAEWVSAVVERYDGDGEDDMPGLLYPIKHWEVMNEPDLSWDNTFDDPGLNFYQQEPKDYAELLKKTNKAIKESDSEAYTVIAGAAGGDPQFLAFYKPVFADKEAVTAFDIANVHCISNDNNLTFNVDKYKALLTEYGIDKPIWVTEAEALMDDEVDKNIASTTTSVKNALALGAERMFFTGMGFTGKNVDEGKTPEEEKKIKDEKTKEAENPTKDEKKIDDKKEILEPAIEAFKKITSLGQEVKGTTTQTFDAVKDAFVNTNADLPGNADNNYGSAGYLEVALKAISSMNSNTFLQFDLSSIPTNATVSNATLKLNHKNSGCNGPDNMGIYVSVVSANWGEASITYNNQPTGIIQETITLPCPDTTHYVDYNATSIVASWVSGQRVNYGISLKDGITSPTPYNRYFTSREAGSPPKLEVTYTVPEPVEESASELGEGTAPDNSEGSTNTDTGLTDATEGSDTTTEETAGQDDSEEAKKVESNTQTSSNDARSGKLFYTILAAIIAGSIPFIYMYRKNIFILFKKKGTEIKE